MTEDFLAKLWTLVKLRYLLIWAHARTRNGKIVLLFMLYLMGISAAFIFALSGIGTALADEEFAQGGFFVRWMLAAFFMNGLGLPLLFGIGTRAAYTEESLRRYPLDQQQRFIARQVIGVLDPIWLILMVGVIGMVIGFTWIGRGRLFTGMPAGLLFIVANYLAATILLSAIGLMVRTRRGSGILGVLVLGLISFGPLVLSLLTVLKGQVLWAQFDRLLRYTPPGAAATMMIGESAEAIIANFFLLIVWCGVLALILKKLENFPPVSETTFAGMIIWNDLYDRIANLFGRKYAPFVGKALRYNLRCNLIRFSLLTSPLLVVLGKYMIPERSPNGELMITLSLFFITSSATGAAMMLNLFGFDDAGIRRYAVSPATFATALRAGSFASLVLRAVTMLLAFAIWMIVSRAQINLQIILAVFSVVIASLFLFNALGLWTSVLSTKRGNFESMWNNRLSLGANLVMIGGVAIPYVMAIVFSERVDPEMFFQFWWIPGLLMILCVLFYAFSLRAIEPVLETRREMLINLIAGAKDK